MPVVHTLKLYTVLPQQPVCTEDDEGLLQVQVRSLCENQRGNVQLLPFYTRIAATLSAVFPDLGAALLKAQEEEFDHLQVTTQHFYPDQICGRRVHLQLESHRCMLTLCCI